MLSATNYFLAGKYFARFFLFSEQKRVVDNSLQLFRLPSYARNYYINKNLKSFAEEQITLTTQSDTQGIKANLKQISNLFKTHVQFLDFDYEYIQKLYNNELNTYKLDIESIFHHRNTKSLLKKLSITEDVVLDSFSVFPVIGYDQESLGLKGHIVKSIFPKLITTEEVVIISGEMIWSGWFTVDILLSLIEKGSTVDRDKLVIIDVWGILQQALLNIELLESILSSEFSNTFFEYNTLSLLYPSSETSNLIDLEENKEITKGIFVNNNFKKYYSLEFSHKPDYIVLSNHKSSKSKKSVPFGMEVSSVEEYPLSMLGKQNLSLEFPADTLIQKVNGNSVVWKENIGTQSIFKEKLYKVELPKQVALKVKHGQLIGKNSVLGVRSVLKRMIQEEVKSPYEGRVDTKYWDYGLLRYEVKKGSSTLEAPFEGELLELKKKGGVLNLSIDAYVYTVFTTYQIGPNLAGKLVTLKEYNHIGGSKILLLKENELLSINAKFIIQNNIDGIILTITNYKELSNFIRKIANQRIHITIVLLSPLSFKQFLKQWEVLYLYIGNTVVIKEDQINLLIPKKELKQIYLYLKPREQDYKGVGLKKGDELMFFNYFVQERYARMEKFSNKQVSLLVKNTFYNTDLSNILKFTNTVLDA